ncbi:hypothetical protein [Mycolicibacterium wolinskyi]|uniref:hypothetical protein n=1 Tax=Mycolicibacterium wolinskyi TaxID=59750 RepID=UPI0039177357
MTTVPVTAEDVFQVRKKQELDNLRSLQATLATEVAAETATQSIRDRIELQLAARVEQITSQARDCATLRDIVDNAVRPITGEVQTYLQGVLYRRAGLDNGTGAVAQWMLNDIADRAGVGTQVLVAFDDAEHIVHTFGMIRMRQQDTTVWRLPILVHELGHHVAHHLRNLEFGAFDKFPVMRYLENAANNDRDLRHLHELFADIFATYVLGAAYPTCVLIQQARGDQDFDDHDDTHPSWPARVHAMLTALRAMASIDPKDPTCHAFANLADREVEPLWFALSNGGTPASTGDLARLQQVAADVVGLLGKHCPSRLRCDFGPQHHLYKTLTAKPAVAAPDGTTIAHVLDAAWRWRANNIACDEHLLTVVSNNALRWCAAATR